MAQPSFDLAQGHGWFGMEFNNAAWELVEAPRRTKGETSRMLHLAHASLLHWQAVGTPANEQRGLTLLATAYAVDGDGPRAVEYARAGCAIGEEHDQLLTPFDRAAAAMGMALSLRSNHQPGEAADWESKASALAQGLDDDDRVVIERLLKLPLSRVT